MAQERVVVGKRDIIEYRGRTISAAVLDAITDTNARLLWAFMKDADGNVQPVAYTEDKVIWMTDADVLRPDEVEI
jgi:hypothetical protein